MPRDHPEPTCFQEASGEQELNVACTLRYVGPLMPNLAPKGGALYLPYPLTFLSVQNGFLSLLTYLSLMPPLKANTYIKFPAPVRLSKFPQTSLACALVRNPHKNAARIATVPKTAAPKAAAPKAAAHKTCSTNNCRLRSTILQHTKLQHTRLKAA